MKSARRTRRKLETELVHLQQEVRRLQQGVAERSAANHSLKSELDRITSQHARADEMAVESARSRERSEARELELLKDIRTIALRLCR